MTASREATVGTMAVRRALPQRGRRTIGAWCFVDHFGPLRPAGAPPADIGPHPHCGLHTVTWLVAGEMRHRDSLGSDQTVRPGQLNLMTAGNGVAHAEEEVRHQSGPLHGVQLWVAQPAATRGGPAAFEHHPSPPRADLPGATATVLLGALGDARSAARTDTPLVGAELSFHGGRASVPLTGGFEHGVVVLGGEVHLGDVALVPGRLAYLAPGREELDLRGTPGTRALLIGGEPFPEALLMWWNFVARTREEMEAARAAWASRDARFGGVATSLGRIEAPGVPWRAA